MDRDIPTVPAAMKVTELSDLIAQHDPHLTRRQGIPILDQEGKLVGIITCGDVLRYSGTRYERRYDGSGCR